MNNIGVFLNHRIIDSHSSSWANTSVIFGDFCLTPIRCLFKGNKVTVSTQNQVVTVSHTEEYADPRFFSFSRPKRNALRVVASILFLVPGILLGVAFKGLGHLSKTIRERHSLAVQHYTPINRLTIGSDKQRLDINEIEVELTKQKQDNHLQQKTRALIIYAKPGTKINTDPGLLELEPQKIVLVGAKIVHEPCGGMGGRLDDTLLQDSDWETGLRKSSMRQANFGTFVTQWKVNSVNKAIRDIPPRKSMFSCERYRRIYVVEEIQEDEIRTCQS